MKRILLIKLTSLGDLIHALPALTDARGFYPDIEIDWLVDEHFQEIATWHPAIKQIFTTNHREWRHGLAKPKTISSIYSLIKKLRSTHYDLIIDGQGNFKTGLFTLCMKGLRVGFDRHSVREPIAHLAYQKKVSSSKKSHAINRLRELFAGALDYPIPKDPPDCGILEDRFRPPPCPLPESYLVFVHNASWQTKLWPEGHWKELIRMAVNSGYKILLPWGNPEEKARAKRLAISPQVQVLPKLSLSEVGYVLKRALACVSMDTGLSHLIAALNIPSLTLYGATDSGLIGASGKNQLYLRTTLACAPCNKKKCKIEPSCATPPCLAQITPELVFNKLLQLLTETVNR